MRHLFRAGYCLVLIPVLGSGCAKPNRYDPDASSGSTDASAETPFDRTPVGESSDGPDAPSTVPDSAEGGSSAEIAIPAVLAISEFCTLYGRERVYWLDRCGVPRDPDRQLAELIGRLEVCPEPVEAGVMQQRFGFRSDVARRCLETQFRSCESTASSPDCNPLLFLEPRVQPGGACNARGSCATCGAYPLTECIGGICDSNDPVCDGKCARYRAVGEECSRTDPTMKCNPETNFCAAGIALRCAPRLDENETCTSGESAECRAGLICVSSGGPVGVRRFVCRKPGGVGDACALELDWHCVQGLSCVEGRCRPPGGAGDPCVNHNWNPSPCRPQFVCVGRGSQPGVCRAPGGSGADCWQSGHCLSPLTCIRLGGVDVSGRCGPPLSEGAACVEDQECSSPGLMGNLCMRQKCTKRPAVGGECNGGGCPAGSSCRKPPPYTAEYGTCLMEPTAGQNCLVDGSCATGLYCDESRHCVPKRAEGSACMTDGECEIVCRSGRCQRCP
jgi:hypothetical protein